MRSSDGEKELAEKMGLAIANGVGAQSKVEWMEDMEK